MSTDQTPEKDGAVDEILLLDQVSDEFEAAWSTDTPPQLEIFVERCPPKHRNRLLLDLLAIELDARMQKGDSPDLQEYCNRFPGFEETITEYFKETKAAKPTITPFASEVSKPVRRSFSLGRFGDYDLIREIARGGMGVVFEARQIKADRIVALKRILSGQIASSEEQNRFRTEALAAANLDFPNIVPVFEVGDVEGQLFFSMGYIDGESLSQRLHAGPLETDQAVRIVLKVAAAVSYAHQNGVIHRDLKPGNILIGKDDEPFVTDFGLAKRIHQGDQLTATGQILGTPGFMPPEQATEASRVDERADVYSLGAVLYQCITGRPPFQSADIIDTLKQVIEKEPVSPRLLNPRIDRDLETICIKCLQKEPSNRFQSADEFQEELQRYHEGMPIRSRPISRLSQYWRWCKRNPLVAGLTAAVAVSLVAGTIISTIFGIAAYDRAIYAEQLVFEKDRLLDEKDRLIDAVQEEKHIAQTSRYGLQIQESNLAIDRGDFDQAEKLLANSSSKLQGWEFGFLNRKLGNRVFTLSGHKERVGCLAYHPSDGTFVSADLTGELILWSLTSHSRMKAIQSGHEGGVLAVAFSGDGKLLATSGVDRKVTLWNPGSWEKIATFDIPVMSSGIVFTRDSQSLVVAGGDELVRIIDINNGNKTRTIKGHKGKVRAIDLSEDGEWLVTSSDDLTIRLSKLDDGSLIKEFKGHERPIWTVDISPNKKQIVSGSLDNRAVVWNVENDEKIAFRHAGPVFDVLAISEEEILTASYDGTLRIWNHREKKHLKSLKGHTATAFCAVYLANEKRIVSGSWDKTIRIWRYPKSSPQSVAKHHEYQVSAIAISPDSQRYASASFDHSIVIGQINGNAPIQTLKGHDEGVNDVFFDQEGKRIASAGLDHTIRIWDASDGKPIDTLFEGEHPVNAIAWILNDKKIVSGDDRGTIRIHDIDSGRILSSWQSGSCAINDLDVASDNDTIAVGDQDGSISLFSLSTSQLIGRLTGHQQSVQSVHFRKDGRRLVSGGADRSIRIWDTQTLTLVREIFGHSDEVASVRYLGDSRIVSGSFDFSIRIWDPITGSNLLTIGESQRSIQNIDAEITKGHTGQVLCVAASPDETTLVTGGIDRTVRFWRTSD